MTSGPLHPVVSGRPRGTPGSNIRARPTATSTPCRPDASVSPLRVPAAAPSVRGGTHRRRVLGVCNRLNTSRLVRGRLRKILRYATPRRPPATVVDVRRAIRVEGSVQILLHHKKLLKITISPIAHVPTLCKKLMILSRSKYLIIFTLHRYRRTSTTVSLPSVRGATTRRRVPPLRTCHNTTPHV